MKNVQRSSIVNSRLDAIRSFWTANENYIEALKKLQRYGTQVADA